MNMKSTKRVTSREKILACAMKIILSRGFAAMTIDAVCDAAKVTKGAFFHYFSSKEAMGTAVLDYFWQEILRKKESASYQNANNDIDHLLGYLDYAIKTYQEPYYQKGCMLAIYTMELSESHPELYNQSTIYFLAWKAEMHELLEKLSKTLNLNDFDAKVWTEMYISTVQGVLLLARVTDDPKVIDRGLKLYKKQLFLEMNINVQTP
jgi:TetR/AcrR family transcriptional repressor of nem operon